MHVQNGLRLDLVVAQSAAVLQPFAVEEQTLLVRWDALEFIDLGPHLLDHVARIDLQNDRLIIQFLHEDLHMAGETQDQVNDRLLLYVAGQQWTAITQRFSGEDQTLLVPREAILRDRRLNILDPVIRFDFQRAIDDLYQDLHTVAETQDQVKSRLLANVVGQQGAAERFTGEGQTLVRRNALLLLDLGIHMLDYISRFDFQSDGANDGINRDLKTRILGAIDCR